MSTDDTHLVWHVHPARREPAKTVAAVIAVAAISFGAALLGGSSWWGVLAVAILSFALNRFFFASRFEIDNTAITAAYPFRTRELQFKHIRRFVHDQRAGFLSTRSKRSILDAYTGLHILFDDSHRSRIEAIQSRVNQQSDIAENPQRPGNTTQAASLSGENP